jgi:CheY-like chemotaxis protein
MNRTDRGLSVLYVDDEAGMQGFNSLVELLEDQGLRITSASNATTALKLLDEPAQRFDAVLLDIIMPPFDCYTLEETEGGISTGWRLLEDMRRRQPTLPVVVVSVIQMKDVNGVRARYGVKRVLPKESPTQSIVAAVREAVSEVAKR